MNVMQLTSPEIVQKVGPLKETYPLFEPSSVQSGAEISFDRINDPELAKQWFYTANVALFTKNGKQLIYGIGGKIAFNAVFGQDTGEVCDELVNTGFIHLNPEKQQKMWELAKSSEVVFVNPSDLDLKGDADEFRYFPIRTGRYQRDLSFARMPFVRASYGEGVYLDRVMAFLGSNPIRNIKVTSVYTLNPEFVDDKVKDGEMVARACRLGNFNGYSYFGAVGRSVYDGSALRGVLKVAVGDEPQKTGLEGLIGKAKDTGRGVAVVHEQDVSPETWQLLTRKQ